MKREKETDENGFVRFALLIIAIEFDIIVFLFLTLIKSFTADSDRSTNIYYCIKRDPNVYTTVYIRLCQ